MTQEELDALLSEYDDVTNDVRFANRSTFQTNLDRWFEWGEELPRVSKVTSDLEAQVDLDAWLQAGKATMSSMVGSGQLSWPRGAQRTAMQLALFRYFANNPDTYSGFYQIFMGGSTYYDDMLREILDQIFAPMSRDLRRIFTNSFIITGGNSDLFAVPASDRTVRLDHNDPDYKAMTRDFENLEDALRGNNDYSDMNDKEQRIAEVGAMRRLLLSVRVRTDTLISLVYRGLRHFAKSFADKVIGALAVRLLALLGHLTGLW